MSWPRVAANQGGVIAAVQLADDGLSVERIRGLRTSGALVPLGHGTYLVRGAPQTYEARLWWAVLSCHGVLGFATAAHVWGQIDQEPERVEVIVPRACHQPRGAGVRIHRIDLRPTAVTTRHGLPVTTRRDTALDYLGRMPPTAALSFADRAVQQGWLAPRDFSQRVEREPGRIGNTRLRLLSTLVGDGAAAHSERVLHRILRNNGLAGWCPNFDVWVDGQLVAVLDVAFPEARVAIEIDGFAFHHARDRFQRDRSRQNTLVGLGWTVLRFTWADLMQRPGYVVATISRALRNSGRSAG